MRRAILTLTRRHNGSTARHSTAQHRAGRGGAERDRERAVAVGCSLPNFGARIGRKAAGSKLKETLAIAGSSTGPDTEGGRGAPPREGSTRVRPSGRIARLSESSL